MQEFIQVYKQNTFIHSFSLQSFPPTHKGTPDTALQLEILLGILVSDYILTYICVCVCLCVCVCVCVLVAQSCPTLCDPMDCSPPGSSVLGIPQARILEWVAIPFSRGSS